MTEDWQSHAGAVDVNTPKVQYAYADGSANTIRPTAVTYPNGRVISFDYGSAGGIDDATGRVRAIKDGALALVQYGYLGRAGFVEADYTEPEVRWTLVDPAGNNDPDTGDIYSGLDRFGRVKDHRWRDYDANADLDRIRYGHDRAGNRIWRENVVAAAASKDFDELYHYDGLHRLQEMRRGRLSANKDAIQAGTLAFRQQWGLDPTGNWPSFSEDEDGDQSWDLVQARTHNPVNEITGISNTTGPAWSTPAYDPAGNMTTIPKPADPGDSFTATFDAWNRLVKLEEDDGQSGLQTVQENAYDGRRFRILRKDFTAGSLAETRHFYYTSGWRAIEERVDASTDAERQFVWGERYIDDLVCRDRDTTANGTLDERLYALQDANWNVTAVTDETGALQERYAYSAYGSPFFLSPTFNPQGTSQYDVETLFAGYRYDVNIGAWQVRNRVFSPDFGWITRDPNEYAASSNLYEYVTNRPIVLTDPLGLVPCEGGEWHLLGWSVGGHFFVVGWYYFSVTWQCKQRRLVEKVTWCLDNDIYKTSVYDIPTAEGTMRALPIGPGLGGSVDAVVGYVTGAPDSNDLNSGLFPKYGGVGASVSAVIVGIGATGGPGTTSGTGTGGLSPSGGVSISVGVSLSWSFVESVRFLRYAEPLPRHHREAGYKELSRERVARPEWVPNETMIIG